MQWARATIVLPLAVALAVAAFRAMTFAAPPGHPIASLERSFAGHPKAAIDRAMTHIGTAAARGEAVPSAARRIMAGVARRAPLADEPFLVAGTIAQMAGEEERAERLFVAARDRNPRSRGARYFLAERYLKTGRILPGLIEMGVLARLSETASQAMVPALAAYARSPGAIVELRRYFARSPSVRDSTLALLAADRRNAPLVWALAPPTRAGAPIAEWQVRLIEAQMIAADYAAAERMWSRVTGITNRGLLFNPRFLDSPAPPPFNWRYPAGTAGVAEPSRNGGLDVVYYGRDDATFASQLLRLAPGGYRLSMRIDGPSPGPGLSWSLICLPAGASLLTLPLAAVEGGRLAGNFTVPATACPAQSLELRGQSAGSGGTIELTIRELKLAPMASAP